MKKNFVRLMGEVCLAALLLALPTILTAKERNFTGPLLTRTQNPLLLQFLQLLPTSAETLGKGHAAISAETAFSNIFEKEDRTPGTGIDIDMEIWRSAFFLQYGLGHGFELDLEIPFLHTSGGFLDSSIQSYHRAFGFPNGGRENVANGRFSYGVSQNGAEIYSVPAEAWAASDWTLLLKKSIVHHDHGWNLSLQHLFKIPVGQASNGSGSGNFDYGFSLTSSEQWKRLQFTTQIGFVFWGGHSSLHPILRNNSFQWIQSVEVYLLRPLSLLVQLQGMTPPFKNTNDNKTLDVVPLDLIVGFAGKAFSTDHGHLFWQVGFGEDPLGKGPSVDFSTYFRSGWEF